MKKPDFKSLDSESFQGDLGEYKVVQTSDNSRTVWSEKFDECAHSLDGAIEETLYNYIEGTRVLEKLKDISPISIFEIGFALGIGVECTFNALKDTDQCFFVSTEIDEALVKWSLLNSKNEHLTALVRNEAEELIYYHSNLNNKELIVLIGDARESIPKAIKSGLIKKFDCFYQDPYSPKKNPTLWTQQWFELMKEMANDQAILATYSASTSVRKAMHAARWGVFNRKGFHGKRASTYAIMGESTSEEVLTKLNQSSVEPLRDETCNKI